MVFDFLSVSKKNYSLPGFLSVRLRNIIANFLSTEPTLKLRTISVFKGGGDGGGRE